MRVSAARLGKSPLTLDWSGLIGLPVPREPSPTDNPWTQARARFSSGEIGFYDAPLRDELSALTATQELAKTLKAEGWGSRLTDCLVLGIGGSALGPLAALEALEHLRKPELAGTRFHFAENPDPIDWKVRLTGLKPESTLVVAITKSGTTFETAAQLLCAMDWLTEPRWSKQLIAVTDPEAGDLRALARDKNLRALPIAPSIGGRFSVFTPVGLLAMELAGLDPAAFLKGAAEVHDALEKSPAEKNPVLHLAQVFTAAQKSHPVHVCMPYSTRLARVGDWFVQLWGESLGKDGKGLTPLGAVGATAQHSLLQLLRDGPRDKVTGFISIDLSGDQAPDPIAIPRVLRGLDANKYPALGVLQGHSLAELLEIEYRATSLVLSRQERPHFAVRLDRLDERALGALFFFYCALTATTGTAMGVNPFDQPGVEEGKRYIKDALGRSGSDASGFGDERPEDDENSPVNRLRRARDERFNS